MVVAIGIDTRHTGCMAHHRVLASYKAVTPSKLLAARQLLFELETLAYEAEYDYVMAPDDISAEDFAPIEARWFAARDAHRAIERAGVLRLAERI
jgi:hypothetical protein